MGHSLIDSADPVDPDSVPMRYATFFIGVIAPEVFIVQPGFVLGTVECLQFTDAWAGYAVSAEMSGLCL